MSIGIVSPIKVESESKDTLEQVISHTSKRNDSHIKTP